MGLPRGGPSAAITTKAVLRFGDVGQPSSAVLEGEAYLASLHPGVSVDEVVSNTGWKLRIAERVETTPEPSVEELKAIREYDKKGFWTK